MTRLHKSYEIAQFKATPSEGEGSFQAVVSVIGNVDLQGDRVMPHAFDKSKEKWQKSGDPIPVIWSHEWGDPFAHIGYIDPNNIEEIGKTGALQGGLLVTGHLDVDKPFAKQVYDLLAARRVKEFSFAYDIPPGGEKRGKDGANELHELDIIEIGPTLKGANSETALLGVKARLDRAAQKEHQTYRSTLQDHGTKWDGGAAMAACKTASDYRQIAFERANDSDPDTAAHWALPHHPRPGADADPAGVAAALAALHGGRGGPPDLKDRAAAERHLQSHSGSEKANEKSGRVIGVKAAAALKQKLFDAVEEFVAEINGGAEDTTGEKSVDEAVAEFNKQLEDLIS